jgi:hypothetical protein
MQFPRRASAVPEAKPAFALRNVLILLTSIAFVALLAAGVLVGRSLRRLETHA